MSRGAFIVIEGLDRSGKTTQTAILCEQLEKAGKPVKLLKFPDRTTAIGKMIDAYLRSQSELDDRAIHLLFSANRWELASQIEKSLQEGTTIVCDRYAFSGIAFSASKGLSYEWCRAPDISLPSPDLVLFLDIPPEKAKERGGYGEERYEKEEMQKKVRQVFGRIGDEMTGAEGVKWIVVDAGRDQETVSKDIWSNVEGFLGEVSRPIRRLWDSSDVIKLQRVNNAAQHAQTATPPHAQPVPHTP
ncbi:Thymidylate kinase [Stygiomarasmius scandens]|uniref:dTMP kinase n=1 Tax=Marasmiellus scandens TaxID=2682957 RepID=A0ABR1K4B9_9AGAR